MLFGPKTEENLYSRLPFLLSLDNDIVLFDSLIYKIDDEDDETKEIDFDNPVIVAEKATKILKLSVGQAVMKMDLQDLPALMFFNSAHGRLNVVYRRADGNISWVDPESKAA